eukprot:SAG11_NODE_8085_length_1061_cov_2.196466_1_plen_63_part_10
MSFIETKTNNQGHFARFPHDALVNTGADFIQPATYDIAADKKIDLVEDSVSHPPMQHPESEKD